MRAYAHIQGTIIAGLIILGFVTSPTLFMIFLLCCVATFICTIISATINESKERQERETLKNKYEEENRQFKQRFDESLARLRKDAKMEICKKYEDRIEWLEKYGYVPGYEEKQFEFSRKHFPEVVTLLESGEHSVDEIREMIKRNKI